MEEHPSSPMVETISIDYYRSIEHIMINFPAGKPLVLFGPNNAGKSNILSAINRILGEKYPTYIEMLDSDFFMRDKETYPKATICVRFSEPLYYDRYNNGIDQIAVDYNKDASSNLLHNGRGGRLYTSAEDRSNCQAYLIDAERNIGSAFNYGSRYSLLSRFSQKIHAALSAEHKDDLTRAFEEIKASFEQTAEFTDFFSAFSESLQRSVKGFVHSLAVDFSAYDPNNYAKSLRIYAKEGDSVRGFEEFGTGEQQVLLMAFVKSYMQIFSSEHFVLIIEEPEAHLHPLAQKWLKEYIVEMCSCGIQVVISTHSPNFFDAEYLEGLVRVYKENGVTHAIQLSRKELCRFCVETGVPEQIISEDNIIDFYSTRIFTDQLKGMFASTIVLVEGATEFFVIPEYLKRLGYSLAEHGVEIINCQGKESIPLFWRLFSAYGFNCYFIFDGDKKGENNAKIFRGIISDEDWVCEEEECRIANCYAYFGKDFETYLRCVIADYTTLEKDASEKYHVTSKPGKAKAVALHCQSVPSFFSQIIKCLEHL